MGQEGEAEEVGQEGEGEAEEAIFVVQDLDTSGQPANKFIRHSL